MTCENRTRQTVLDRTRDRGHGRIELRTLKIVTVHHFGFPHTAQVLQVTRKTRDLRDSNLRRWRTVVVYCPELEIQGRNDSLR